MKQWLLTAVLLMLLGAQGSVLAADAAASVSPTSPQGLPDGWQPFNPAPKARPTRYTLERDGNDDVIRADADHSMSGLIRTLRVDPAKTPMLRWRWRIAQSLKTADMATKAGDDYVARLYVLFDYDTSKLDFGTRTKLALAKLIYGVDVPAAALNYVWDNRYPVGTLRPNAYTDRARMIVVDSGAANAGRWVTVTRDIVADFRAAFGEDAPPVIGVAIATDTDNTGEQATAWYGDIRFLSRTEAASISAGDQPDVVSIRLSAPTRP